MTQRLNIPGRIADQWQNHGRVNNLEWHRLRFADRTYTGAHTKITSWADDDDYQQVVVVKGGSNTNKPGDQGNICGWSMESIGFKAPYFSTGYLQPIYFCLKVGTAPTATSNTVVMLGLTTNLAAHPAHNSSHIGLHYDASGGPDVRAGCVYNSGGTDSGARPGVSRVWGIQTVGPPNNILAVEATGCDNSNDYDIMKRQTRSGFQPASDADWHFFVHVGRSNTAAGDQTIKFKAFVAMGSRSKVWFP